MKLSNLVPVTLILLAPRVQAASQLTFEGEPRACAGKVTDATHTIELGAKTEGAKPVEFEIQGGEGAFFVADTPAATRVILVPDRKGRIALRIRGGAKAQTPVLLARRAGMEIGRVTLDFAPPVEYRRFSTREDSDEDRGYLFSRDASRNKIYLKFRKSWARGDVNGNWAPVAGHRLRVFVCAVEVHTDRNQTLTKAADIERYARVYDLKNPQSSQCILTTRADGSVQFGMRTFKPDDSPEFTLDAEDLTASTPENYHCPALPAAQTLLSQAGKSPLPHWFPNQEAAKARVMWHVDAAKGVSRWDWSDIDGNVRTPARALEIKTEIGSGGYDAGAYGPVFSPNGSQALFSRGRPNQDFDGHHDSVLADLASGKSWDWRDYLFGSSEVWSHDGKKIAFVAGSLDMLGSSPIDPPLRLNTRETGALASTVPTPSPTSSTVFYGVPLAPNREVELRTDNHLNREALAWTPGGDLLAETSWWTRPNHNDPRLDSTATPLILRFFQGAGKPTIWQSRAGDPVGAPDGQHIAFFGAERAPDGNWRDTSPALGVADDAGKNRRALTRIPEGDSRAFFEPDGRHVALFNLQHDDPVSDTISSPASKAHSPNFAPVRVTIDLSEYDISTGTRRAVAILKAVYRPFYEGGRPRFYDFTPLGFARDGKTFFLSRRELEKQPAGNAKVVANTLFAVTMSDGKLFPVAVFPDEFAIAPL